MIINCFLTGFSGTSKFAQILQLRIRPTSLFIAFTDQTQKICAMQATNLIKWTSGYTATSPSRAVLLRSSINGAQHSTARDNLAKLTSRVLRAPPRVRSYNGSEWVINQRRTTRVQMLLPLTSFRPRGRRQFNCRD